MKGSTIRSMETWRCVSWKTKENICLKKATLKMYFTLKVLRDVLDFITKCFNFHEYNFWITNMFVRIYLVINIMKYYDVILMKSKKHNVKIRIINDHTFFAFKTHKNVSVIFLWLHTSYCFSVISMSWMWYFNNKGTNRYANMCMFNSTRVICLILQC